MKKNIVWLLGLLAAMSHSALADDVAIKRTLNKMGIETENIPPSPIVGLSTVITSQGLVYVTEDGKYLLEGPIYDLSGPMLVNVTNQILAKKIEAMSDQMIIFKAPEEKYVVTVFTDVTCGYCKKFHQDIAEYNTKGITIRYLAFPRNGLYHELAKTMTSIWCSADRQKALIDAFKGETISPIEKCKTVDIAAQFNIGHMLGINGTPAMVLEDGTVIPGYMTADDLVKGLEKLKKKS
ncbi:bifunctional protein-disulfide isomerase/oxidoreductase DsbC [Arsenophonus endosymbiont of Aphis craccivora]|uniref:bifunctional protein-disulfide isomerase/oxidoreductase DsbC n=1 Tax=Arsenophonus endosymbiont of Aphis craccivora TaxID=1231049 RepID=UPI0015DC472F|nr:bifunctional protein-disulfide isomerase/oxidoreductase DsbC [Arsenophonus endosymbiont of Aphis craccivora]QLK87796.1 bifunctional protein-disulfide isomerase/oxidoreductase DsbC [Arsenophonus endosymbiont of Aphis craccivora]